MSATTKTVQLPQRLHLVRVRVGVRVRVRVNVRVRVGVRVRVRVRAPGSTGSTNARALDSTR